MSSGGRLPSGKEIGEGGYDGETYGAEHENLAYKGLGGTVPPHSRVASTAPSACYALRVLNGCWDHLSLFLSFASIFAADAPQGRLQTAEEGFPQRFPSSRRGPRSFTPFCTHTHRMWGSIGSHGVAADRDRRGGCRPGSYGVNRGDTSTITESPTKGLALG